MNSYDKLVEMENNNVVEIIAEDSKGEQFLVSTHPKETVTLFSITVDDGTHDYIVPRKEFNENFKIVLDNVAI